MDAAQKIERIRVIQERIRCLLLFERIISAEAAAELVKDGALHDVKIIMVEAIGIDSEGNIIPASDIKNIPASIADADKVIVELNVVKAGDRGGTQHIRCGPEKIAAVVISNQEDYNTFGQIRTKKI